MAVKRNYRINLRNYGNPPAIMVSQYDENYDLVFEVYDGVVPETGLNAYTVKLAGRQPGDDPALKYEFTGTVSGIANNILSFTIDTTMTGRAGKGTAEIVILDATNDVKFASFNLPVYVEKAAVPDDAIDADVERAREIADEVQDIVDTAAAEVKGEAEAWAVGERDGEPVPSTDPTYHNNAKYYSEVAQDIADSIGIDATLSVAGKAADAKKTGDEISSLKEEITALDADIDASNVYIGNDIGYAVRINDGAVGSKLKSLVCNLPYNANGYGSLRVYHVKGKNLLAPINPTQTINGVTFTVNADGTITTSGTSSAVATFYVQNRFSFKANVVYALNGCPSGGSATSYGMSIGGINGIDYGNGGTFTPKTDITSDARIRIASGINTDGLTFKPMVRYAYQTSEKYNENILAIKTGITILNGLTFVRNPDGSVAVSGTATAFTSFYLQTDVQFEAGKTYKLSGCPAGGSATTYRMSVGGVLAVDRGEGGIYTEESTTTRDVRIMVSNGVTLSYAVFRPHLTEIKSVESEYTQTDVDTIIITFPVLIYGGYIDIVTGEITSTTAQNGSAINPPAKYNVTPHPIEIVSNNTIFTNSGYLTCEYVKDLNAERKRVANVDFLENYKNYQETFVTSNLTVGLPILYLVGDTSAMTKDIEANLDWYYKGNSGKCTLKWQGSSSIAYSKKNYTIKFSSNVDFGKGWGAHKKYNLKANYIDFTESRNVVSAKLWGAIVKSRTVQNPYLYDLPNGGATDGFPMIVVLNDEYLGLFDMNIPKDKWMFNMTGSATHEGLLSAENHSDPTRFKATITEQELLAGTSFEVEYATDESDVGWMATSISQAISAVMSATSASDAETINQYIDIESVIDHYIFACLIGGSDITDKNYLLATYDGTKWYMSEWDLDTTFGNNWTGGSYNFANSFPTFADYAAQSDLMKYIYTYQKPVLKARYTALRASTMSESNVMRQFYNFSAVIPKGLKDIDFKKYPLLPTTDTGTVAQAVEWYSQRCKVLDAEIASL